MPQSAACAPLISRPSMSSSLACATPARRGISHDPPESGVNPIVAKGARNRASSATTAKSDASTRCRPRPMIHPRAAVTMGVWVSSIVGMRRLTCQRIRRWVEPARGVSPPPPRCPRSKPEQKCSPAPVSEITRIDSSLPAASIVPISAPTMSSVTALRRSGRSRRNRRTGPVRSTRKPSGGGGYSITCAPRSRSVRRARRRPRRRSWRPPEAPAAAPDRARGSAAGSSRAQVS